MKKRFEGIDGKRRLTKELQRQKLLYGNPEAAKPLADVAKVGKLKPGACLIKQDEEDTDMYFLLAGKVDVLKNGRVRNHRSAGEHVGEMALIDPKARRSATIIAVDEVVYARITEPDFTKLAKRFPDLWRSLAIELAERLREVNSWIRPPNDRPHVFIGSSREGLKLAKAIKDSLPSNKWVVKIWTDGVFQASRSTLQDLMVQVDKADFAVMIFTKDDKVVSRRKQSDAPRDNVIFELGLFMGNVKPERTFIVRPRGVVLKIPTDLLGITCLEYDSTKKRDLKAAVAPACKSIRKIVGRDGPK